MTSRPIAAFNIVSPHHGPTVPWRFERNGRTKRVSLTGAVTVNIPDLAVRGRRSTDSASPIPSSILAAPFLRTGQLVRVLEGFSPSVEPFFLFYPGHRQVPAALRAFIDMNRAPKSAQGPRSLENPFAKG